LDIDDDQSGPRRIHHGTKIGERDGGRGIKGLDVGFLLRGRGKMGTHLGHGPLGEKRYAGQVVGKISIAPSRWASLRREVSCSPTDLGAPIR